MSSNESEFLKTDVGKEFSLKISAAVSHYMRMMAELQYMEEKLPGLLGDLKSIQQKVDKRHKNSNIATIGGCATSIVGSAMILGGLAAAPFTFGASIGLTVAGTVITAGGGIATTGAKSVDYFKGKSDLKKTKEMVEEFAGHYKAAEEAYYEIVKICKNLSDKSLELKEKKD